MENSSQQQMMARLKPNGRSGRCGSCPSWSAPISSARDAGMAPVSWSMLTAPSSCRSTWKTPPGS